MQSYMQKRPIHTIKHMAHFNYVCLYFNHFFFGGGGAECVRWGGGGGRWGVYCNKVTCIIVVCHFLKTKHTTEQNKKYKN